MKLKLPPLPKLSYKGYVRHLRRQSVHVQRLHALVFASLLTGTVAFVILYYDYGFFHDVYVKKDTSALTDETASAPSPAKTFSELFQEAKMRFSDIGKDSAGLLYGTETYTNTSTSTE